MEHPNSVGNDNLDHQSADGLTGKLAKRHLKGTASRPLSQYRTRRADRAMRSTASRSFHQFERNVVALGAPNGL